MRNLKRALSLTLASVMLLGMMVVGSSAAGYPDVSEEENIEAIEVLQSVGVMEGDNNGNFNPDDYVTREQMAVIMSKLLNLDYNYYQGTNPFSDVPAWAAPYVAACAANGITSGIGGGMYGAGQNVNAVQAALMMLKALGYFQYQADFDNDYVLATVKQATEIGMFAGIDSNAQAALTRNEVAQMALNALKADMVRFTGDVGIELPNVGNVGYKSEYTPRTSTDPKYNRLIDNKHSSNIDTSGQYYIQLGEELYDGNLVQRYDSDIFERPSYTWTYKTELIGTYVDKAKLLASYTSGVTGRTLHDLLNNITLRDYDLEVYVDGHVAGKGDYTQYTYAAADEEITASELVRSNTSNVGATADGVLTEVYLDRDNEVITIASIHTWLAQGVSAYNETRESATMKVYMTSANGTSKTVNVDDVAEVEGVAADTFYLVRMSDKDTKKLEVVDIDEPEILAESTITQFSNGKKDNTSIDYPTELTTNGTKYKDSDRAIYDAETLDTYDKDLLANNTYNVYLDKYGYFIGIDLCEGTKQYVFVTGYDMRNSNLSVKTAEASGIFLDGTMDTITVNVSDTNKNIKSMVTDKSDSNAQAYYQQWGTNASDGVFLLNRWYTYTKTEAGVYTLKPCVNKDGEAMMLAAKSGNNAGDELKLNCAKLRLDGVDDDEALLMGEYMTYVNSAEAIDGVTFDLDSHRAYGEDASVFITVDVDRVSGSFGDSTKITRAITGVNGVYSGVQDVDIITELSDRVVGDYLVAKDGAKAAAPGNSWMGTTDVEANPHNNFISASADYPEFTGKTYVGENAYAVYDKNNFIIGAVILGEAVGGTKNFAYVLDPVKNESYRDGNYYWQFEAVMNGEKVTLDAKSKFSSTIDTLRNNWHAMVELRFTDDVVTEVVEPAVTKIYGNPFSEIIDNPVDEDNESIYDVILTGPDYGVTNYVDVNSASNTTVKFANIFRGDNKNNHNEFVTTQMGYLNLQGRTLWVLDGQADHGIDFVRDAKAVVIQPENGKEEIREYDSVQGAVDSLGDPIPGNDVKEFYGIISAALNSQGVAEWVVFYSNTNVDTRNNVEGPVSTMDVVINVKFPGSDSADYWRTIQVAKPTTGTLVMIDNPDTLNGSPIMAGYTPKLSQIPVTWERNATNKSVTFEYEVAAVASIRITKAPTKTTYTAGDAFDAAGMEVEVTYTNGTKTTVKSGWTLDANVVGGDLDSLATSDTGVKVTIGGKSAVQAITVNAAPTPGITVTTAPTKTSYKVGENVNWTGAVLTITAADGTTSTVDLSDAAAVTNAGLTISGDVPGTYNAAGFDATITRTDDGESATQHFDMAARTGSVIMSAASGDLTAGTTGTVTATATLKNGATITGATCTTTGVNVSVSGTTVTVAGDTTTSAGTATVTVNWENEDGTAGTPVTFNVTIN